MGKAYQFVCLPFCLRRLFRNIILQGVVILHCKAICVCLFHRALRFLSDYRQARARAEGQVRDVYDQLCQEWMNELKELSISGMFCLISSIHFLTKTRHNYQLSRGYTMQSMIPLVLLLIRLK